MSTSSKTRILFKWVRGFELVGAPWLSKRPNGNPIVDLLNALPPAGSIKRICVGHGIIDIFTPDKEAENVITVSELETAISEGKVHFIALGDRHSLTKVGFGDRIWYSGTPESTDFREDHSGFCQDCQSVMATMSLPKK